MSDILEIKADLSIDDAGTVIGIAWPFGSPDSIGDLIEPTAFQFASQVPMMMEHKHESGAVGLWDSMEVTDKGLEVKGRLFVEGVKTANAARDRLRSGAMSGLSIGYPLSNEKDFARAWGKFQYVPAGHASAPTDAQLSDALIKLVATLRRPYKSNAVFVMNGNTAVRLRQIKDTTGHYLWAPTGNLIEGIEHPLLGYRVEIDDNMPDIGADKAPIAFGDFRQGYVIVDRQGIQPKRDELTMKGFVIFDTYKRVGGGAGDFNAIKFLKIAAA
jgi:HK97 family phage prohead protease